jgi:dihydrofolate reductase
MAKLTYTALTSLDGFIEDREGSFEWAAPDDEVHAFVNDLERGIGTHLYGRRLYEVMASWETMGATGDDPIADYARIWQAADKVVISRSIGDPWTARTRVERTFDADRIRRLVADASSDVAIGGAELAAEAFRTGLIDECQLFLNPIAVGSGKRALPADLAIRLELLEERRFENGVVYLRYAVRR